MVLFAHALFAVELAQAVKVSADFAPTSHVVVRALAGRHQVAPVVAAGASIEAVPRAQVQLASGTPEASRAVALWVPFGRHLAEPVQAEIVAVFNLAKGPRVASGALAEAAHQGTAIEALEGPRCRVWYHYIEAFFRGAVVVLYGHFQLFAVWVAFDLEILCYYSHRALGELADFFGGRVPGV